MKRSILFCFYKKKESSLPSPTPKKNITMASKWKRAIAFGIEVTLWAMVAVIAFAPTMYYKCNKCKNKDWKSIYVFETTVSDIDLGNETRHLMDDVIIVSHLLYLALIASIVTRMYYIRKMHHLVSVLFLAAVGAVLIWLTNKMSTSPPFPLETAIGAPIYAIFITCFLQSIPLSHEEKWVEVRTPDPPAKTE